MTPDEAQQLAIRQIRELLNGLVGGGWDFAAVTLYRRVGDGHVAGASTFDTRRHMLPMLPRVADNVRVLAREIDEMHERSGVPEALESYTEVVARSHVGGKVPS